MISIHVNSDLKNFLILVCCPVTLSSGDLLAVTSFRYNFTCFTCDTKTEALVNHSCRLMHTFTWGEHYRAQNRSPSRWQGLIYLTRQLFKSCLTSCNKALGDDFVFFSVWEVGPENVRWYMYLWNGRSKRGGGEVEGREYCCHPVKEKSLSINASFFTSRSRRVLFT